MFEERLVVVAGPVRGPGRGAEEVGEAEHDPVGVRRGELPPCPVLLGGLVLERGEEEHRLQVGEVSLAVRQAHSLLVQQQGRLPFR